MDIQTLIVIALLMAANIIATILVATRTGAAMLSILDRKQATRDVEYELLGEAILEAIERGERSD